MSTLKRLISDREGATVIEYGFIVSMVSIAGIAGWTVIGGNVNDILVNIATYL